MKKDFHHYFIKRQSKKSVRYVAKVIWEMEPIGDVLILKRDEWGLGIIEDFRKEVIEAGYSISYREAPDLGAGVEVFLSSSIERNEVEEMWKKVLERNLK